MTNSVQEWRAAAKKGHELGNHTLSHPYNGTLPGNQWVIKEKNPYTVARAVKEIRAANQQLKDIDGKSERTFVYPCEI